MPVETHKQPPTPCPECRAVLNFATGAPGRGPVPGDLCVCTECGAINLFGDGLVLRTATPADLEERGTVTRQARELSRHIKQRNRLDALQRAKLN